MPDFNLSIKEQIVNQYPWYSIGYYDIFSEICKIDAEASGLYLDKVAPRVFSRAALYDIYLLYSLGNIHNNDSDFISEIDEINEESNITADTNDISDVEHTSTIDKSLSSEESKDITSQITNIEEEIIFDEISELGKKESNDIPNFILAGGDYFSRADMEQLELDKSKPVDNFIAQKPSLIKSNKEPHQEKPKEKEISTTDLFDDYSFYTETLAKIYQEQGFYKRAVEVYAKLILLYPEKSSYFASLVDKIKEKYNQ